MTPYRIGEAVLELEVIGAGYQGGVLLTPKLPTWKMTSQERRGLEASGYQSGALLTPELPAWKMTSQAMRDLDAFEKAGWRFQEGADLYWGGAAFREGSSPAVGLLALHPSGGLVVVRNRLVVQFRAGIEAERISHHLQPYFGVRVLEFGENLFEVGLSLPDDDLDSHILRELTSLLQDPEVVFAEPSILYHVGAVLGDYVDTLDGPADKWHWEQIDLLAAWTAGGEWAKGKGRRVAIIDEGFHAEDPQIKQNVEWMITLDQDGRIVTDKPVPEHYHGTMCAGLIGAVLDNSEVNGVAPSCTLGLVALGDFCVCSQVALGIALRICADLYRLTDGGPKGKGADVISCSLGITGGNWERSKALRMAIDCVVKEGRGGRGTPIVWATFDTDKKIEPWAVEGYAPLIVASRSDHENRRVMSGWGEGLDLLAPGHDVSVIFWDVEKGRSIRKDSGSSLAAPCVAGVAALVLAVSPNLTCEQVANVVTWTCDPPSDPPKWCEATGWGRLNARRAVEMALKLHQPGLLESETSPPPALG